MSVKEECGRISGVTACSQWEIIWPGDDDHNVLVFPRICWRRYR